MVDMRARCDMYLTRLSAQYMTAPPTAESCGIPHKAGAPKVFTNTTSLAQAAYVPGGWCQPQAIVQP